MNAKEYMIKYNVAVEINNDWQDRIFRHLMRESGEKVSKAGLFYVVDPDVAPVYWFFLKMPGDKEKYILCASDRFNENGDGLNLAVSGVCDRLISVHELKKGTESKR